MLSIISVPELTAVTSEIGSETFAFVEALTALSLCYWGLVEACSRGGRLLEQPVVPLPLRRMTDAVAVSGLVKRFGAATVLQGVDLAAPAGQVTCLIGPSGSGKSTLLRCIALLEQPTAGRITDRRARRSGRGATAGPAPSRTRRTGRFGPASAWCSSSSTCGRT